MRCLSFGAVDLYMEELKREKQSQQCKKGENATCPLTAPLHLSVNCRPSDSFVKGERTTYGRWLGRLRTRLEANGCMPS